MAERSDITPELCRQLLRYEPEAGKLYWRERPLCMFPNDRIGNTWNSRFAGKEAGHLVSVGPNMGYRVFTIHYIKLAAHRVIRAMLDDVWPDEVDHNDGNRGNNRDCNLIATTHQENMKNLPLQRKSKSGVTGVRWDKARSKWLAAIGVNGKFTSLGRFSDFNEACAVRREAEKKYGYNSNHGLKRERGDLREKGATSEEAAP